MGAEKQVSCGKRHTPTFFTNLDSPGGTANPCCFEHKQRGLALVVHGDDFTTLGRREDLLWFHNRLSSPFEIKARGILGEGANCEKEMRILNRIVRISDEGILYESEPRHVETLLRSLEISSNPAATPGVKPKEIDASTISNDENAPSPLECAGNNENDGDDIPFLNVRLNCVAFDDEPTTHFVAPYAEHYAFHPREFVVTSSGRLKLISATADPFTGKSKRIMDARWKEL